MESIITLNKSPERDFVILNLTDTHLTGSDWTGGSEHFAIVDKTIKELLERVRPDLITLTGDYSTEPYFIDLVRFADYMESFGIPWAPVWGNHDNSGGTEFIDHAADVFMAKPHCIFEKGNPSMGCGNYVIRIHEDKKPVSALFMMDSHRGSIYPSQIRWFETHASALRKEGCGDSAVLMHIPLTEFETAFDSALIGGIAAASSVDLPASYTPGCWNAGFENSFGIMREKVCPIEKNDEWFDALKQSEIVKYLIAGHEHINNFAVTWQGIRLVYSLKTGFAAYGWMPFNGGSVIRLGTNGITSVSHEYVDVSDMLQKN